MLSENHPNVGKNFLYVTYLTPTGPNIGTGSSLSIESYIGIFYKPAAIELHQILSKPIDFIDLMLPM